VHACVCFGVCMCVRECKRMENTRPHSKLQMRATRVATVNICTCSRWGYVAACEVAPNAVLNCAAFGILLARSTCNDDDDDDMAAPATGKGHGPSPCPGTPQQAPGVGMRPAACAGSSGPSAHTQDTPNTLVNVCYWEARVAMYRVWQNAWHTASCMCWEVRFIWTHTNSLGTTKGRGS
jgi:hypothetical protein